MHALCMNFFSRFTLASQSHALTNISTPLVSVQFELIFIMLSIKRARTQL